MQVSLLHSFVSEAATSAALTAISTISRSHWYLESATFSLSSGITYTDISAAEIDTTIFRMLKVTSFILRLLSVLCIIQKSGLRG